MSHGGNVWQGPNPGIWQDHSANIRPGGAPDWVREAVIRGLDNMAYYPEPNGARAAAGIAEYLGLPAQNVIATAGGISAIDMAAGADGSELILLTPCFTEYADQARRHGKTVRRVSVLRSDRNFDLTMAYGSLSERCCVWLCNPMNPSGKAFDISEVKALLARIENVNGRLFVDEAFMDYCREYSACSLLKEHPGLAIVGSMTKSLGIPGARLGYICGSEDLLASIGIFRRPWEVSCFAESVAMELPKHKSDLEEDAILNAQRRRILTEQLEALGVFVYESHADFLLCRFRMSASKLAQMLKQQNILVRECMDYDIINDDRHLRIAVKADRENEYLIEKIGEAIKCAENH